MEVVELSILNAARAADFEIQHLVGMGQNGMVVAATCSCRGLPNPGKLYAVKLLFNFTHEYSSVLRNTYENEWLVLSRLLPHENIVRFATAGTILPIYPAIYSYFVVVTMVTFFSSLIIKTHGGSRNSLVS